MKHAKPAVRIAHQVKRDRPDPIARLKAIRIAVSSSREVQGNKTVTIQ